ncbi:MAG: hypothetical protein A2Y18_00840 [Clostridiales bacterium GWD2_32_19]|nr:MAG: hypothetical protein A2Y18_00840 [Clostridiales bacterium GWD2_32_19]
MKYISEITDELRVRVLECLYEDELFNVFLIHFIESQIEDIGELYITESYDSINSILHMKFDGNSYFTSFYYRNEEGLNEIIKQLKKLNYSRILLSGKMKDVSKVLDCVGKNKVSAPDIYYKFDINKHKNLTLQQVCNFRIATDSKEDLNIISKFMIGFFEPTTQQETADLINTKKLLEDLKVGIYFIEYNEQVVGMARISGKTKKYVDITTVYIDPQNRGKGFSKSLMEHMVQIIISENKIPVMQASSLNIIARKTYESLGFVKEDDYLFEFIS